MPSEELEEFRPPRVIGNPHGRLAPMVVRDYSGYDGNPEPEKNIVFSATTSVLVAVHVDETDFCPHGFIMGPRDAPISLSDSRIPAHLEVWLDPLSAHTLLGTSAVELSGQLVDLGDVLGPAGRSLRAGSVTSGLGANASTSSTVSYWNAPKVAAPHYGRSAEPGRC